MNRILVNTYANARRIDRTDARILCVLQAEGRISYVKLAEKVHLSPSAIIERVRRLVRTGYIRGFRARIDAVKVGAGLLAFIEIKVASTTPDSMRSVRACVQAKPEIVECHAIGGDFDYLIKARVADLDAYRELMASFIWALPGVREVRVSAAMAEIKAHPPSLPAQTTAALRRQRGSSATLPPGDCNSRTGRMSLARVQDNQVGNLV